MLPVQYYHVRINSSEGEVILEPSDNTTTLVFKHLDNQVNITFTVNITVVDIKGLRSASSVALKTISGKYNYDNCVINNYACV